MKSAVETLIAEFADGARQTQIAEDNLRRQMAAEIAKLERRRQFAFRRAHLVKLLASVNDPDPIAAIAAQRRAVTLDLGWSGVSDIERSILDRLEPVAVAAWKCACDADGAKASDVAAQLNTFEDWHEQTYGKPFYVLFDRYSPEAPVVDF